jgi:ZIP family zinc transporter
MRGQPELYKMMLLAFTAGVLTTLVVEELIPEAHEEVADSPISPLIFAGGFALFALISAYLEFE